MIQVVLQGPHRNTGGKKNNTDQYQKRVNEELSLYVYRIVLGKMEQGEGEEAWVDGGGDACHEFSII